MDAIGYTRCISSLDAERRFLVQTCEQRFVGQVFCMIMNCLF